MAVTTIQISEKLKHELCKRKLAEKETYEEVIWDLIEDVSELNEEVKKELKLAEEEYTKGEFLILSEVKKKLKIKS
ncbi:hypothetical protein DRJ16_02570 [Candidatus Woesearchaeota archaeon]|nr:hypothetical protein [Candidatus Woesearchaeota archaeon]RLE44274.1 MAG: hypothetical protein DRJ16_02570 [Candidatus Woesearchaeota archaeon]